MTDIQKVQAVIEAIRGLEGIPIEFGYHRVIHKCREALQEVLVQMEKAKR